MTAAFKIGNNEVISTEGDITANAVNFADGTSQSGYSLPVLYSAYSSIGPSPFQNPLSSNPLISNTTYGRSVDISGNYIAVGAPTEGNGGVVFIFNVTTGHLVSRINNPTPGFGNSGFGNLVSISGQYVLIGTQTLSGLTNTGFVHVYNIFTRTFKFLPNPSSASKTGDFYGSHSLALSGKYALIGVNGGSGTQYENTGGAVHVYDIERSVVLRTITGSIIFQEFGSSISVDKNIVAIGAPGDRFNFTSDCGAVFVYDILTGSLIKKLTPALRVGGDVVGTSVAINGNFVVAGAPGNFGTVNKVHVFDITGTSELYTVSQSQTNPLFFGSVVAMFGNYFAVGTPEYDLSLIDQGRIYIYNLTTGALLNQFSIIVGAGNYSNSGRSLAMSGNYLVIGSAGSVAVTVVKNTTLADIVHQLAAP